MTSQPIDALHERRGDNLYPERLKETFGEIELDLHVPAGVWNPTPHGAFLGEMLATRLSFAGQHVLELGAGCGLHSIVLARRGARRLMLSEIEEPILECARHNLELGAEQADTVVETQVADWTHVEGGPYDALVTNPPFAKSGKRYRRYFIDTLILDAHKLVKPGGTLTFIHSSMADVKRSLDLMEANGMQVDIIGETDGPFRPYYFEDPAFMREIRKVPDGYSVRSGTYFERLVVFHAQLPS